MYLSMYAPMCLVISARMTTILTPICDFVKQTGTTSSDQLQALNGAINARKYISKTQN